MPKRPRHIKQTAADHQQQRQRSNFRYAMRQCTALLQRPIGPAGCQQHADPD